MYAFGSESSHANTETTVTYADCLKAISIFHDFLIVFYNAQIKVYDAKLAPIGDYYAVPKSTAEQMGITLDIGKNLYIQENKGGIRFYVLTQETDHISKGSRRDIDVLEKLWVRNFDDPANIIRQAGRINGPDETTSYRIYALPSKPICLNKKTIDQLTFANKKEVIQGICKGVATIHNYTPALYHRNICPDSFYIFNIRGRYKALLSKFEYTKDTSPTAAFTVFKGYEKNILSIGNNAFLAPEVVSALSGEIVDWEKADIYSLAKTCLYILSGEQCDASSYETLLDKAEIDDEIKLVLLEMLEDNPKKRPSVNDLVALF